MMGNTHRWFGLLTGMTVATVEGATTTGEVVIAGLIASAVAHGELSPDADQTTVWRRLPIPTSFRQHRHGLAHWWVLPVLAWGYVAAFLPAHTHWAAMALVAGWSSHLLGDLIFGTLSLMPNGAGPRIGLRLKTDGFIESGKLHFKGKSRTVIPFGPTKFLIIVACVALLWFSPDLRGMDLPSFTDLLDRGMDWVEVNTVAVDG